MHRSEDPLVHVICTGLDFGWIRLELLSVRLISKALLDQEAISIVPGQKDILHNVSHALLLELQDFCTYNTRVQHVHSNCIGTVSLHDFLGIWIVLQALAHLLAIGCKHHAIHNEILERRLVEQMGTEDHKSVKPSSGLVQTLCNELRRETFLKLLLALKRIVLGAVWHGAAFKPAVEHLIDSLQHPFALLGWDLDVINKVPMKILDFSSGIFFQLGHTANANNLFEI
mmetsp:Transcript_46673/g.74322  ORF Transcript_46673/g.74322 Transcript_46673/m.74322 type:complete len:228 (+) Transcript_46673:1383-2066(+)